MAYELPVLTKFLIMRHFLTVIFVGATLSLPSTLPAESYSIDWHTVGGGGGISSGTSGATTYTVSGTIGQPATAAMSGGGYSLTGGFWSIIAAVQTPGAPYLSVMKSGNQAVISWPATATGFILEYSPSLPSPGWNPASVTLTTNDGVISTTVPVGSGNRFYRLYYP
jgi:hypothetical protein